MFLASLEKKSTDCGDKEVLLYFIEMSSSSKVELHILLDKKFVLLYRWLHLDQRKKVRWKITYLLGQQGEGLIKENVTSKPDVLVLSPCNPYWDSSVQATLMKFYKLPFQMQGGGSRGWWGQKPFLVISYPSHREGVSCKSRQRKKGKKKTQNLFQTKAVSTVEQPAIEQKSAQVFEVEQSSFITYRWLKSFVGFKNLLVLVSVQKVRKQ